MTGWTVIASTGKRFRAFAPYAAAVNNRGEVAFQAERQQGGTGVYLGDGGPVTEVTAPTLVTDVSSHPALNDTGAISFYGMASGEGEGVFLLREELLETIAATHSGFTSIGPLGPTMNGAGDVAFRADREHGISGIFIGHGATLVTVADTQGAWQEFYGLPVIRAGGVVVFRADRADGVQGIYEYRAGSLGSVAETGFEFATLGRFPSVNEQGTVAFAATLSGGGAGIFTSDAGHVTRIIDAPGAYEVYRGALITGTGMVVRIATPPGGTLGLFAGPDPQTHRILAIGDRLLDSVVVELAANPVSVNAFDSLAVRATLADGRQVILRTELVQ